MAGEFSELDVKKTIDTISEFLIKGKVPGKNPRVYILGGQPGAGKTALQNVLLKKEHYNAIVINGDEYRKFIPYHDEMRELTGDRYAYYTQKFANRITEGLIERLGNQAYNLIIEGTLRNKEVALSTSRMLQNKGYMSELSVLAVNKEISYYSTKLRAELLQELGEVGRMTPTDNHNEVVRKLPENVSAIYKTQTFDNITVYNRHGKCLYNMEETPEINPGFVVEDRLNSVSLEEEQEIYHIRQSIFHIEKSRGMFLNFELEP